MAQRDPDLSRSAHAQLQGNPAASVQRKTLQQNIAAMRAAGALRVGDIDPGQKLHQKFAAAGDSFTFKYGSVREFFAGLEGLIGSPSSDVMAAMEQDHASTEPFEAWNSDVKRTTTPRAEWVYVVQKMVGEKVDDAASAKVAETQGRGRQPSHVIDATEGRKGWKLEDFANQPEIKRADLLLPEVAGIRLYTGPMYKPYNDTLRFRITGVYITTLHAINSGIVKLSKLTKATTVYRGVSGGVLPEQFWVPNEHGVIGGVDLAFMSTSTERDVALGYMKQSGKDSQILFEIRMGMIDRGADVSMLSQFPGEREILFAPLTGLELAAVPRDELGVLIIELRLSCNLQDQTIDQVIGKMKTSHIAMIDTMMDDLKLGIPGLPLSVLGPLEQVKADAMGHHHKFFAKPQQHRVAFDEALLANDAAYSSLAKEEVWADVPGDGAAVAELMRTAATKCAQEDRPKEAAVLLMMAARRDGAAEGRLDALVRKMQPLTAEQQRALDVVRAVDSDGAARAREAASALLAVHGVGGIWASTLVELGTLGGDRHTVGCLAQLHGHPPSALWGVMPLPEYADLRLDRYMAQRCFHHIKADYPGVQLIHEEPYVFVVQGFCTDEECKELRLHYGDAADRSASASFKGQEERRTSTQVVMKGREFPWLQQRIAKLCNVSPGHMEPAKLTRYEKGEFFRTHSDAEKNGHDEKLAWLASLSSSVGSDGGFKENSRAALLNKPEQCKLSNRFVTAFLYLNDVPKGGRTTFNALTKGPSFYDDMRTMDSLHQLNAPQLPALDLSHGGAKASLTIEPRAGMVVVHFPSTTPDYLSMADPNTLHESEDAIDVKYIVQQFVWPTVEDAKLISALGKAKTAIPEGLPPGM